MPGCAASLALVESGAIISGQLRIVAGPECLEQGPTAICAGAKSVPPVPEVGKTGRTQAGGKRGDWEMGRRGEIRICQVWEVMGTNEVMRFLRDSSLRSE